MTRTSVITKEKVVTLFNSGFNIKAIVEQLKTESICITRQTVSKIVKYFIKTGSYSDKAASGRPSKLKSQHREYIEQIMRKDDETSSTGKQK